MTDDSEDEKEKRSIGIQVSNDFLEEFDLALKSAQIDGHVPLNMSRSAAIRRLMRAAINDPSLLAEDQDQEE